MLAEDVTKSYERGVMLLIVLLLVGIAAAVFITVLGSRDARVLLPTDHVMPIVPIAPRAAHSLALEPGAPTPPSLFVPATKAARSDRQ